MSVDQVSEVTSQQQIADLQNELRETQIQLQKLRAAAWGAADIFRREAEDCGNGRFIATPTMVEILWAELNDIPEDLDLLRWARENELADLREEVGSLRAFVSRIRDARRCQSWAALIMANSIALAQLDAKTTKPECVKRVCTWCHGESIFGGVTCVHCEGSGREPAPENEPEDGQ